MGAVRQTQRYRRVDAANQGFVILVACNGTTRAVRTAVNMHIAARGKRKHDIVMSHMSEEVKPRLVLPHAVNPLTGTNATQLEISVA